METPQRPGAEITPGSARERETFTTKEGMFLFLMAVSALRQINSNVWTARMVGIENALTAGWLCGWLHIDVLWPAPR